MFSPQPPAIVRCGGWLSAHDTQHHPSSTQFVENKMRPRREAYTESELYADEDEVVQHRLAKDRTYQSLHYTIILVMAQPSNSLRYLCRIASQVCSGQANVYSRNGDRSSSLLRSFVSIVKLLTTAHQATTSSTSFVCFVFRRLNLSGSQSMKMH